MKIILVALNAKYIHTNIAVRYIKKYCSEFEITIKEYTINDSIYNIMSDLYKSSPDVICFSCYIWNIEVVLKLCSNFKKIKPEITTILGGPEVSFDSSDLMRDNLFIDYIIKGEGEVSSKQFFNYINGNIYNIKEVNGLVYRVEDNILENECAELIEKLDDIPFPYDGEYLDDKYVEEDHLQVNYLKDKILYYESSRGCPYRCSYCLSSTIKGVRFFSKERIEKDLLWFIKKNVKLVKFVDRTFNCSKYAYDIFKFIIQNSKYTKFHFEISADILDIKIIELLKTAPHGLIQFEIGLQSTNVETLDLIDRKMDLESLNNNILKLRECDNIHLHLDLIAGLPGEGYDSFSKSINDTFSLRPHMLQLGFLKLLKGSKMRNEAHNFGISFTDYPPYEVLKTDSISYDQLLMLKHIEDIIDRYYNSGRFNATLKYLMSISKDPFMLFKNIGEYKKMFIQNNRNLSNIEQYRLLYDFCMSTGKKDMHIVKECLAFDYLLQGRNPVVPDFLLSDRIIDRRLLWDLMSDRNIINNYLPNYEGKDVKKIIKDVYARNFSLNICAYIDSGEIINKDNIIIFDYGSSVINGNVSYFCICV